MRTLSILLLVQLCMLGSPSPGVALMPWDDLVNGFNSAWNNSLMLGIFLKALLGGALAPIAKDLLVALTSVKFAK